MTNFFSENEPAKEVFFRAIKPVVEGLIYISEIDGNVVPFVGPRVDAVTAELILRYAGLPAGAPVDERSTDDLFGRLTEQKTWHGEREKERTKKFLELQKVLEEFLSETKVFRIGQNPIDIFIAGRLASGRLAGVRTTAVET